MKTAFLFPGQGAQFVGMGKDLVAQSSSAKSLFERANAIVGYDLQQLCFEGPEEQLNTTAISQPAIFVVSAALLEQVRAEGIMPEVTAGLSMGEYTALYAAGLISFEDGLKLVQKRGKAMQAAADASNGSMVSILGLDDEKVYALCEEAAEGDLLVPVNFNCPGQIVISGTVAACQRAVELAPKYDVIKAVPLSVAGAFHSAMMQPAADELAAALADCPIDSPFDMKVIGNIHARYYIDANDIRQGLVRQLIEPILWQKCMETFLREGYDQFYEIGPGRVLTGLMRRIDRKTKVINVSDAASVRAITNR